MTPAKNRARTGTHRTGRLRAILATGSVLLLAVGATAASFTDVAWVSVSGDDRPAEDGIGYDSVPAIWLSDAGNGGVLSPQPSGRNHWTTVISDVPISADRDNSFIGRIAVAPRAGAPYALAITPTISAAPAPGSADATPWLRFTVVFPDGRVVDNMSAAQFNAYAYRSFNVCHAVGSHPGCGQDFTFAVTVDPLTPYIYQGSKVSITVNFEGSTTQIEGR